MPQLMFQAHRRLARVALAAFALAAGACVDQPTLFDPNAREGEQSPNAPRVVLGTDTVALYEGDAYTVRVPNGGDRQFSAEVLLVDSTRSVLWRSGATASFRDSVRVPITNLPASLPRGVPIRLSAAVVDAGGRRYYATSDTVATTSLSRAAVQPAIIYEGRVLRTGGQVVDLVGAGALSRVFYADRPNGQVGVVDLASLTLGAAFRVGALLDALDYAGGQLGVLSDGGTEVSTYNVMGQTPVFVSRAQLPPLVARFTVVTERDSTGAVTKTETTRNVIRPFSEELALLCADAGCGTVRAFGASRVSAEQAGGAGVIRQFGLGAASAYPAVVTPTFDPPLAFLGTDTIAARLALVDVSVPTGRDSVVFHKADAWRCGTLGIGGGPITASTATGGALFASSAGSEDCFGGVPLVRIDRPGEASAAVSQLAVRNLLGENRIGDVVQIEVSDDGSRVLVLDAAGRVHVLDSQLRVRGTVAVPGAGSIAWLREASPGLPLYFAVGTGQAVEVYGTSDLQRVRRVSLGPLVPRLLSFVRPAGASAPSVVVVPASGQGVLVARVPLS